jgi:hypothetical protein
MRRQVTGPVPDSSNSAYAIRFSNSTAQPPALPYMLTRFRNRTLEMLGRQACDTLRDPGRCYRLSTHQGTASSDAAPRSSAYALQMCRLAVFVDNLHELLRHGQAAAYVSRDQRWYASARMAAASKLATSRNERLVQPSR